MVGAFGFLEFSDFLTSIHFFTCCRVFTLPEQPVCCTPATNQKPLF